MSDTKQVPNGSSPGLGNLLGMTPEDAEELFARRMTDRVVALAEQQVKRRYLWINLAGGLAFIVLSWFGGTALMSTFVKDRVDDAVRSQQQQIHNAELDAAAKNAETKSKLIQLDEVLKSQKEDQKSLKQKLSSIQDQADSVESGLNDIISATNTLRKLSEDVTLLKGNVQDLAKLSDAVAGIQDALKTFAQVNPALESQVKALAAEPAAEQIGSRLAGASKSLNRKTVFLQFSGSVSRQAIQRVSKELQRNQEFRIPGEQRVPGNVREVRYFYPDDDKLAMSVASEAQDVLRSQGFGDVSINVASYEDYPKSKPPKGTVELWLGGLPDPTGG